MGIRPVNRLGIPAFQGLLRRSSPVFNEDGVLGVVIGMGPGMEPNIGWQSPQFVSTHPTVYLDLENEVGRQHAACWAAEAMTGRVLLSARLKYGTEESDSDWVLVYESARLSGEIHVYADGDDSRFSVLYGINPHYGRLVDEYPEGLAKGLKTIVEILHHV